MALLIFFGILVILALWLVSIYNRMVRLKNTRENAFANIDVQLRQRHDLVPQLVETVKGYSFHEKDLLEKITQARSAAVAAGTIDEKIKAENTLTGALQGLRISVEAYPDLKANQNFMQLQQQVATIENNLAGARRDFNASTRELNTAIETFPGNLMAGRFGFTRQPMFEIPEESKAKMEEPPEIKF